MGFGLRKLKKHCVTLLLLGVVLVVLSMHWMSQQATSKSFMSPKYALMQSPRFASSNSDDVGDDVDTKNDDDDPIPPVQLDPQVNPFQFRDPSERLDDRQKSLDADKERRNIFDKSQRKGDDERRQKLKDDEQSEVDKNEQNLLQKIGERDRQMAIDPKKQKQADLDARQKQNEEKQMGDSDEDRQDEEMLRQKDAARQGESDDDRQEEDGQDENRQLDPEDKRREQDAKKNSLLDAERQKQAMQRRAEGNMMREGGGGGGGGERNPDDPPSGGENGDPPGEKGGKLDFEPPANAPVDTEFLKKMAENHDKHKGNPLQNVLVHPRDAYKSLEELKLGQDLVARDNQRMQQQQQQQQQQHPKLDMFVDTGNQQNDAWNKRRLHRTFSLNGLVGGNMYSSKGKVVHVAIFVERPSMTFAMALTLSITKHTTSNVTFHFVTLTDDRQFFKEELDKTILERQGFEIVEFPNDWLKGFSLMEVGHYYIPDLMPYMSGRLLVLDPYCLVTGDIKTLFTTNIGLDTWAGMPSLCKPEMSGVHLPEKYKDYLNFSNPEIGKLKLSADACAMSPAVKLQDLPKTRLGLTKNKLWKWTELNQKEPLFLKGEGRDSRIGPTIVTFQGHSKTLDEQWYCPVDDKSSLGKCSLYHWVGEGKPGTGDSQMATLWNTYLVPATAPRPRE